MAVRLMDQANECEVGTPMLGCVTTIRIETDPNLGNQP